MKSWKPEEIESFRKKHKISRRALGELLGVTGNCIYQWERGLRKASKTVEILLSRIEKDFEDQKGES